MHILYILETLFNFKRWDKLRVQTSPVPNVWLNKKQIMWIHQSIKINLNLKEKGWVNKANPCSKIRNHIKDLISS